MKSRHGREDDLWAKSLDVQRLGDVIFSPQRKTGAFVVSSHGRRRSKSWHPNFAEESRLFHTCSTEPPVRKVSYMQGLAPPPLRPFFVMPRELLTREDVDLNVNFKRMKNIYTMQLSFHYCISALLRPPHIPKHNFATSQDGRSSSHHRRRHNSGPVQTGASCESPARQKQHCFPA